VALEAVDCSGRAAPVDMNYKLIKEISDNEVWTSLYASTSIEVVVDMRLEKHEWNVDTLHSGKLIALDAPQRGPYRARRIVFRSEQAILPYQGVLLWWRPDREPERKDSVAEGASSSRETT